MKKFTILAAVLVLTAALLTGCFGGRSNPSEAPGSGPSATSGSDSGSGTVTMPSMPDVMPNTTEGTDMIPDASSPEDSTRATDEITPPEGRARGGMFN